MTIGFPQALVTLAPSSVAPEALLRALPLLPWQGFGEIMDVVAFEHEGVPYRALFERAPLGGLFSQLLPGCPLRPLHAARALEPALMWVSEAHAGGVSVGDLRPEAN